MANHASALKRNRQRIVRTARNRTVRTSLRSSLKAARAAIEAGDATDAATKAGAAKQALAKAASKGVIHANQAARKTSRLDHALARLVSA
jgi:small subunit ribosomal protein S20